MVKREKGATSRESREARMQIVMSVLIYKFNLKINFL